MATVLGASWVRECVLLPSLQIPQEQYYSQADASCLCLSAPTRDWDGRPCEKWGKQAMAGQGRTGTLLGRGKEPWGLLSLAGSSETASI